MKWVGGTGFEDLGYLYEYGYHLWRNAWISFTRNVTTLNVRQIMQLKDDKFIGWSTSRPNYIPKAQMCTENLVLLTCWRAKTRDPAHEPPPTEGKVRQDVFQRVEGFPTTIT